MIFPLLKENIAVFNWFPAPLIKLLQQTLCRQYGEKVESAEGHPQALWAGKER